MPTTTNPAGRVFPQFPLLDAIANGVSPDGFIFNDAWHPGGLASGMFTVPYGVTRPGNEEARQWFAAKRRVPVDNVGPDFAEIIGRARANARPHGSADPVVWVSTPTHLHAGNITAALQSGLDVLTDKPVVTTMEELKAVRAARGPDREVYVSFQHFLTAAAFQMRQIVRDNPGKVARIDAGFLQDWMLMPNDNWRGNAWSCGLADIWTHAAHLLSFVGDSFIASVGSAKMQSVGEFARSKKFSDEGSSLVTLENGLYGDCRYHQSLAGHADDIYVMVTLTDGTKYLWKMAWGPDTLFVTSSRHATLDSSIGWEPHLRGHSKLYGDEALRYFPRPPGGHVRGWLDMWIAFFLGTAGDIFRRRGLVSEEELPWPMRVPVPKLEQDGVDITAAVAAHELSASDGGRTVTIKDVLKQAA